MLSQRSLMRIVVSLVIMPLSSRRPYLCKVMDQVYKFSDHMFVTPMPSPTDKKKIDVKDRSSSHAFAVNAVNAVNAGSAEVHDT